MENAASLASGPDGRKRRVSFFYEPTIGEGNQRVSQQISATHNLIRSYGLHNDMEVIRPRLAEDSDFIQFHSPEYISFLRSVTPEYIDMANKSENVADDTSTLLIDYCRLYAGGSISAAAKLNRHEADIAINWSGGMHRAKRDEACDFGYVNDVVLGILELLNVFKRVLYIEIGYFHWDAVQEAFDETDRVMTISFHKHGAQSSGYITDYGVEKGEYYSLNAPLKDGLDDATFVNLLVPVIHKAMKVYQPEAIVLLCGPDSLAGDELGKFNLTTKGHAACLQYIRSFHDVPLMLLGGQGHTLGNVARCWCYETAVAVGKEIDDDLAINVADACFAPDYQLHIKRNRMENLNTDGYITYIKHQIVLATAMVLCHRFFLRQSHAKNDRWTIATICMLIAGKVERGTRLDLEQLIIVSSEIIHKKAIDQRQEVYEQQKELVLCGEKLVLSTLNFDISVDLPYYPLTVAIEKYIVDDATKAQFPPVAWRFVNDSYLTTLSLQYKPRHIAGAAFFLAAKYLKMDLESNRESWCEEFDITPIQLEDIRVQMRWLYKEKPVPASEGSIGETSSSGYVVHQPVSGDMASTDRPEEIEKDKAESEAGEDSSVGNPAAETSDDVGTS